MSFNNNLRISDVMVTPTSAQNISSTLPNVHQQQTNATIQNYSNLNNTVGHSSLICFQKPSLIYPQENPIGTKSGRQILQ